QQCGQRGDDDAIEHRGGDIRFQEGVSIASQGRRVRPPARWRRIYFILRFERCREHPGERDQARHDEHESRKVEQRLASVGSVTLSTRDRHQPVVSFSMARTYTSVSAPDSKNNMTAADDAVPK